MLLFLNINLRLCQLQCQPQNPSCDTFINIIFRSIKINLVLVTKKNTNFMMFIFYDLIFYTAWKCV